MLSFKGHRLPSHISKMVLSTVKIGPPDWALQRRPKEFRIVDISSGDHHIRFLCLNRTPYAFSLSDQSCFEIVT